MSRFFARLAFSLLAVLPLTLPVLAQETPEVTDTLLTEFERLRTHLKIREQAA